MFSSRVLTEEQPYVLDDFQNSNNGIHPGCKFIIQDRPHRGGSIKRVAEWVLEHAPGVPGRRIPVPVGMLNGLLTRISDLAGACALLGVQDVLDELGFACRFMGTNDDSTAILAVPGRSIDETAQATVALMTALNAGAALFGIETNMGKMNISAFIQELNTLTIALKANGALTVMMPSMRSLIGAVRRTPGFDWAEEGYQAMKAVTAGIKEGCDQTTATTALAFIMLTRLQCTKMDKIALAQASGLPIPHGFPNLDSSPAPHLTGRPCIRSYWSAFTGPAQSAACIVEKLMGPVGKGGVALSKGRKLEETELIDRVCASIAVSAIAQQCRVLADQSYKSVPSDDLSRGMGPYLATLKGPPLVFELGEHSDGLLSPDFLKDLDTSIGTSGLPNSIRHTVQAAFRTIINQLTVNSARRKNRIIQKAMVQANIGGIPRKEMKWDPTGDHSDLPKRLIIERPELQSDGRWGRIRGEVSFWWFINFCKQYDWEAELILKAPLVTVLTSSLRVSVQTMRKVSKVLATDTMGLVEGYAYTMHRTSMSSDYGTGKLSAMDLARLLDPSPMRNAAMEFASLALRSQNADLRAVDLSILGNPETKVTMGDLDMIRQVSYTIDKHLNTGSVKGYLLPTLFAPSATLADACLYHAVGNVGMNLSAYRLTPIAMPMMKVSPVFTTITPNALDAFACSCIWHFLNNLTRDYMYSETIVGALPNADRGTTESENVLRGTSFNALLIGLQVAAALGIVLTLSWLDMQILTRKEASREAMVFLHARPGRAVRAILGCRFEPELTTREIAKRREFQKRYPDKALPKRGIRDDQIVHAFCTEVLDTKEDYVEIYGGRQEKVLNYVYTQHIYTTMLEKEFASKRLQIVFTYKFRGTRITKYLQPNTVLDGTYATSIPGRTIKIHWGCKFHVTVACYPPHVCLATCHTDEKYEIIPIAGIDCKQNLLESEYNMPPVTPYPGDVVRYRYKANPADIVEKQGLSVKAGKGIATLLKIPEGELVEEKITPSSYTRSRHGVISAADTVFISNARELAVHAGSRTMAASIAAAFMVMTPWEAVRGFIVAILQHAFLLGDSDSQWCFGVNKQDDEHTKEYIATLDVDLMADKMVGESSLLAAVVQMRDPSMSSLFFNTTIEAQMNVAIRAFLETEIHKNSGKALTVHLPASATVEDVMRLGAIDELELGDTVLEDNTKRIHYIHQTVPREVEAADPVEVHIPVSMPSVPETEETPVPESEASMLDMLMHMATQGTFGGDDDVDNMIAMEDEDSRESKESDMLQSIIQASEAHTIRVSKETTQHGTTIGEDGFQTSTLGREVKEDVFSSDFDEQELSHILIEAEAIPFADKVDFKKHHENLNHTAALILGVIVGKGANLRGRMGGGWYAYKARTLYGGVRNEADVIGHEWLRDPAIGYASMVDRKAYANVVLSAFNDEVTPPSDDSAGLRYYKRANKREIAEKSVRAMREAGETRSSNSSLMAERVYMIGAQRIPLSSQRVLINSSQTAVSRSTSSWEIDTAPAPSRRFRKR